MKIFMELSVFEIWYFERILFWLKFLISEKIRVIKQIHISNFVKCDVANLILICNVEQALIFCDVKIILYEDFQKDHSLGTSQNKNNKLTSGVRSSSSIYCLAFSKSGSRGFVISTNSCCNVKIFWLLK